MTYEEAKAMRSFGAHCTCGGYAWKMNGRPEQQPHTAWCPQAGIYAEWYEAIQRVEKQSPYARS